jgi:hypothetical protein
MVWIWGFGLLAVIIFVGALSAIPLATRWRRLETISAVNLFHRQRKVLQAQFLDRARAVGKPRGLRWIDCDWIDAVTFARDRKTNLLAAFAGINIRFEAIEGGDMEDVEAVSTIRDAVAVFHFHAGTWGTGGKALFNMNPAEAIDRLVEQFEPLTDTNTQRTPRSESLLKTAKGRLDRQSG